MLEAHPTDQRNPACRRRPKTLGIILYWVDFDPKTYPTLLNAL